jgi:hypothetical protein
MVRRGRRNGDAAKRPLLRPRALILMIAAVFALTGCRSNQKSALVEAELRTRDREIRSMRSDLERLETFNSALVHTLRDNPVPCPQPACTAPPSVVDGPVSVMAGMIKQISLGRGTGGLDEDGLPGDEALQVVVVPQDVDGSAVKVPGSLVVQALEITPEGLKSTLSRWDVPAVQLQRCWRSGLFSTGYFVTLPWKVLPSTEKLRVIVQFFTLPDNRPFEAERDVHIRLMTGSTRRPLTAVPSRDVMPEPYVPGPPIMPGEPTPKPMKGGSSDEGPLLTPGAWLRERAGLTRNAAKVSAPDFSPGPARLLDPLPKSEDDPRPTDQ